MSAHGQLAEGQLRINLSALCFSARLFGATRSTAPRIATSARRSPARRVRSLTNNSPCTRRAGRCDEVPLGPQQATLAAARLSCLTILTIRSWLRRRASMMGYVHFATCTVSIKSTLLPSQKFAITDPPSIFRGMTGESSSFKESNSNSVPTTITRRPSYGAIFEGS